MATSHPQLYLPLLLLEQFEDILTNGEKMCLLLSFSLPPNVWKVSTHTAQKVKTLIYSIMSPSM